MKEKRTIACYETDTAGRLKPFAFFNLVQEWANLDAINLGFGYEQLIEKESIWVLSRLKAVSYVRPPGGKKSRPLHGIKAQTGFFHTEIF